MSEPEDVQTPSVTIRTAECPQVCLKHRGNNPAGLPEPPGGTQHPLTAPADTQTPAVAVGTIATPELGHCHLGNADNTLPGGWCYVSSARSQEEGL